MKTRNHIIVNLMIEASNIDGHMDQKEINKISEVLTEVFLEDPELVEEELVRCINQVWYLNTLY